MAIFGPPDVIQPSMTNVSYHRHRIKMQFLYNGIPDTRDGREYAFCAICNRVPDVLVGRDA